MFGCWLGVQGVQGWGAKNTRGGLDNVIGERMAAGGGLYCWRVVLQQHIWGEELATSLRIGQRVGRFLFWVCWSHHCWVWLALGLQCVPRGKKRVEPLFYTPNTHTQTLSVKSAHSHQLGMLLSHSTGRPLGNHHPANTLPSHRYWSINCL